MEKVVRNWETLQGDKDAGQGVEEKVQIQGEQNNKTATARDRNVGGMRGDKPEVTGG